VKAASSTNFIVTEEGGWEVEESKSGARNEEYHRPSPQEQTLNKTEELKEQFRQ
jgi:hypothetical protein